GDALLDVAAGGWLDRSIFDIAGRRWCRALAAGMPGKPFRPDGPPAAAAFLRFLEKTLRVLGVTSRRPVAAALLVRRVHDARHMPARTEDERLVAAAQKAERAVRGAPGHDVVLARGEHENRKIDAAEIHRHAAVY